MELGKQFMNKMRSLIETIRKQILELKNTRIELKNSIENFKNRLDYSEEIINKLEDRLFDISQLEEQKEKGVKKDYVNYGTTSSEWVIQVDFFVTFCIPSWNPQTPKYFF